VAAIIGAGSVVWGTQLPVQSQSTIYAEPWEATAGPASVAAVAVAADTAGAHYVAVCDHVAIPADKADAMGTEWWDTLTTLGWLAGLTSNVHLLSHVYVLPYRHPLVVAKGFATLDAISGGRAILGVGAGHVEGEFAALGVDFATRGRALDEAIDGVRVAFADNTQRPRPHRPGGPPIWVGGSSPPALRRAAERGDGWLPQGPPKQGMRAAISDLLRHRAELGRPEAFDVGGNAAPMYVGTPSWDTGSALTGSPDELAAGLRRLTSAGVNQVQVRLRSRSVNELCDQLTAFGTQVWPLVEAG